MEACSGSSYWARAFKKLGHEVALISPQFVKPFVKTNKTDANDAEAIVIAARQPEMRFVPINSEEDQDIQSIHRMRERLVGERTALCNQVRGLLSEYGIVAPQGVSALKKLLVVIVSDGEKVMKLTAFIQELCSEFYEQLQEKEKWIEKCNIKIEAIANTHLLLSSLDGYIGYWRINGNDFVDGVK
jgi:transposase